MTIFLIIGENSKTILAAYNRWELAQHYAEVQNDNGIKCYTQRVKVSNKLPVWAIKHLEEKYL